MSRYIDADKLVERLKFKRDTDNIDRNKYAGLECAIAQCNKAPTADVVEVVRCKDCVYCRPYHDGKLYCHKKANIFIPMVDADDYCSYGERREQNEG